MTSTVLIMEQLLKSGGGFSLNVIIWLAVLFGLDLIIVVSPALTVGLVLVRTSVQWTRAASLKTIFSITRRGGDRSRCCICFHIGIGVARKAKRFRFGARRIWTM